MRTTWTQWITGIATVAIGMAIAPSVAWATDYSAMPTDELMALRGTMRDAPVEEHERFNAELHKRIQEMTAEERQAFGLGPATGKGLGPGASDLSRGAAGSVPGSGLGDGTRPRPMDGTGFGGGGRGGGPRR